MDENIRNLITSMDYNMDKWDKALDNVDNKFLEIARIYDAIKYDYEMLKAYLRVTK